MNPNELALAKTVAKWKAVSTLCICITVLTLALCFGTNMNSEALANPVNNTKQGELGRYQVVGDGVRMNNNNYIFRFIKIDTVTGKTWHAYDASSRRISGWEKMKD